MPLRAFVGVPIAGTPPLVALREGILDIGADVKVVDAARLHATLAFLGDVPDDAPAALARALDAATRGVAPIALALRGVGAFPNINHPRVVWVGVEDPKPLTELALRVRRELTRAGFAFDAKDFRAHVTLARAKSDRGAPAIVPFLKAHGRDELGEARVEDVRLYKSVLSPTGPAYEVLHASPLGASA